jgi:KUP system potassium uptake protein
MIEDFPEVILKKGVTCPWTERLFKVDDNAPILSETKSRTFYTFVMKGMFLCKRARPDIQPAIAFLSTRVRNPTEQDFQKLLRLMAFLQETEDDVLTLEINDEQSTEWYVDAAFAVHPDFKSHTGAYNTLGKGAFAAISTKQKVNSRSSTEAELVAIDDVIAKILWSKRFIETQGFKLVDANVIYRDNTSSMKLEENGRASSGKRTRHFNIRYFFVTDLIQRKECKLEYCPTDEMIADYFTKPLTGAQFVKFRAIIMNFPP